MPDQNRDNPFSDEKLAELQRSRKQFAKEAGLVMLKSIIREAFSNEIDKARKAKTKWALTKENIGRFAWLRNDVSFQQSELPVNELDNLMWQVYKETTGK